MAFCGRRRNKCATLARCRDRLSAEALADNLVQPDGSKRAVRFAEGAADAGVLIHHRDYRSDLHIGFCQQLRSACRRRLSLRNRFFDGLGIVCQSANKIPSVAKSTAAFHVSFQQETVLIQGHLKNLESSSSPLGMMAVARLR